MKKSATKKSSKAANARRPKSVKGKAASSATAGFVQGRSLGVEVRRLQGMLSMKTSDRRNALSDWSTTSRDAAKRFAMDDIARLLSRR